MVVPAELELCSLMSQKMPKLLFVCIHILRGCKLVQLILLTAKFTGYQYGGRPLGLTFVKYMNTGSGDVMEGAEVTGGMGQEQIM